MNDEFAHFSSQADDNVVYRPQQDDNLGDNAQVCRRVVENGTCIRHEIMVKGIKFKTDPCRSGQVWFQDGVEGGVLLNG